MDFLDPKKVRRSQTRLLLGYCLVALAIAFATLVFLYQAYGYGIDKKGNVTQNGIVFASSQPNGASIYLNNQLYKSNTNTRMVIPAGTYSLKIHDSGYREWQRQIVVGGGDVQHYDYPFLFPAKLATSDLTGLAADPSISTQSPDRRWLLLGEADKAGSFILYDLKNADKPVESEFALPDAAYTAGDGDQSWMLVEWSTDNRHVLLQHNYADGQTAKKEYVLVDRDTPADSVNLTATLKLNQDDTLSMFNKKTDEYYVYSAADQTLQRISENDDTVVSRLEHIVAFKSYGSDKLLYATSLPPSGKTTDPNTVSVVLQDGEKTTTLRTLPVGATYLLDLAQYSGNWYVAVGASTGSGVYIYKNPQSAAVLSSSPYPAPLRLISVDHPTYIAFSTNTQFLLAESGQEFGVYDAENIVQYHYVAKPVLDSPQTHATWMDGDRLLYVSGGKLLVFDYDYRNPQTLETANASYLPMFAPDYSNVLTLRPAAAAADKPALTTTQLTLK